MISISHILQTLNKVYSSLKIYSHLFDINCYLVIYHSLNKSTRNQFDIIYPQFDIIYTHNNVKKKDMANAQFFN